MSLKNFSLFIITAMLASFSFFYNDSGYYIIANVLDWYINPVFSIIHSLIHSLATYNLILDTYNLSLPYVIFFQNAAKNISIY